MNVVDNVKEQLKHVAEKVAERVADAATTESRVQAVTIGRPRHQVMDFLRDPGHLSQIFGDIAVVEGAGVDRLRFEFAGDGSGDKAGEWNCVVSSEEGERLRFVDVNPESEMGIVLDFRDAPQHRGTEVIGRINAAAPGALTGPLLFKALYRARALLMTGELPTIKYNPSARPSDR
ncbi:MAG: hypothetical protein K0R01_1575 [Mycobacterium sp.]|nr:hypothetical protein [Mycobacterium sp.]